MELFIASSDLTNTILTWAKLRVKANNVISQRTRKNIRPNTEYLIKLNIFKNFLHRNCRHVFKRFWQIVNRVHWWTKLYCFVILVYDYALSIYYTLFSNVIYIMIHRYWYMRLRNENICLADWYFRATR